MGKINIAVVWTHGPRDYEADYVRKIRSMVLRHCGDWEVDFLCYTDRGYAPPGWILIDLNVYPQPMREGWWGKMQLFDTMFRGPENVVYFDLDTVIVGDITPLFKYAEENYFGICSNFTREVSPDYPCKFGSCVMTFHKSFGDNEFYVWSRIYMDMKQRAGKYGDQKVIETMVPDAGILNDHMPKDFFVGRRDFKETLDPSNAVMIFAGKHKPANSLLPWVKEHWYE